MSITELKEYAEANGVSFKESDLKGKKDVMIKKCLPTAIIELKDKEDAPEEPDLNDESEEVTPV